MTIASSPKTSSTWPKCIHRCSSILFTGSVPKKEKNYTRNTKRIITNHNCQMNRFYKTTLLSALVAFATLANAQQGQSAQSFTLEQCIDYAVQNSISAQNSILDQRIASSKVKETVGLGLPQITGSGNVTH